MRYVEYGKENQDTILLLHGGGLSWWNYEAVAESLQEEYHIVLPILDGHAESGRPFTTIENNAKEIIEYIDTFWGGSVLLIGGLSLGGQIVLEILSQREDICKYAIIESALVRPSKWMYSMIEPAFGSCYGLIKQKWFSRLQFQSLKIRPDLFERYFADTCAISRNDMIAFLQANSLYSLKESIRSCRAKVFIAVGGKENGSMLRSAKDIHDALPGSELQVLPEWYHGAFSINHGEEYAKKIREITGKEKMRFALQTVQRPGKSQLSPDYMESAVPIKSIIRGCP